MKNLKLLTFGAALLVISGCSSNLENFTQYKPMKSELADAPAWVIGSIGKYEVKASAKMVNNEFELARTEARMKAKAILAERISSQITEQIKSKIKKKVTDKNGKTKENLKIDLDYYVNMALIDVREKSIWVSKKGRVWVLLEANPELVKMAIQKAISENATDIPEIDEL